MRKKAERVTGGTEETERRNSMVTSSVTATEEREIEEEKG